jgi:hypothetical protein
VIAASSGKHEGVVASMPDSAEKDFMTILRLSMSGGIPRRSLIVALIVGTILNLINQGDGLLGRAPIDWTRLILTYMVPYAVSTYGAVSALLGNSKINTGK